MKKQAQAEDDWESAKLRLNQNIQLFDRAAKKVREAKDHLCKHHKEWAKKEHKSWKDFQRHMPEEDLKTLEKMTEAKNFKFDRNDELPDIEDTRKAHMGWTHIHEQKTEVRHFFGDEKHKKDWFYLCDLCILQLKDRVNISSFITY